MKQDQLDKSTAALLAKYNQPAPRYTSFPTAVQFKPEVPEQLMETRLNALGEDEPVSLYTHIPFCHQLCFYCGCNTTIVHSYDRIARYLDYLLTEIDKLGKALPRAQKVSRLHFGGGSPNYAKTDDIRRILDRFARYFDLSEAGMDMECDPRLLTEQAIKDLAAIGLSRISLGIQDFDATVQQAINRVQPADQVAQQLDQLRSNGIDKINFDLIVGLPEQTLDTVAATLDQVCEMRPSRIAVFPYAHVPWMKKHQQVLEGYHLPDTPTRFLMTQLVHDRLTADGYVAIGIDHFALPDDALVKSHQAHTMQRNFQGYTDDPSKVILGLGQSSITQLQDAYVQNTANAADYRNQIGAGQWAHEKALALSEEDMTRRALIEQIMSYFEVDLAAFPTAPRPMAALAPLLQDGLAEMQGDVLRITTRGLPFTRIVAACFDPYFQKAAGRHAKAI